MSNKYLRLDLGITKVYLIQCTEGFLLVDTGYEKDYNRFLYQLKKNNIKKSEIKYLFLTHHHDDHVGFAQKLKEELKIPLIVHKKAVQLLKTGDSGNTEKNFPINKRIGFIMSLYMIMHKDFKFPSVYISDTDIVIEKDDNHLLNKIGINGKILYTPGHSSDSMTIILGSGEAICGDVAMNFLGFAGIKHRPIYLTNRQNVYRSWEKILGNGAKTILPSHGNPFSAEKLSYYLKKFLHSGEYRK